MRLSQSGVERDGPIEALESFTLASHRLESHTEIGVSPGVLHCEAYRLRGTRERLFPTAEGNQSGSTGSVRSSKRSIQGKRPIAGA